MVVSRLLAAHGKAAVSERESVRRSLHKRLTWPHRVTLALRSARAYLFRETWDASLGAARHTQVDQGAELAPVRRAVAVVAECLPRALATSGAPRVQATIRVTRVLRQELADKSKARR